MSCADHSRAGPRLRSAPDPLDVAIDDAMPRPHQLYRGLPAVLDDPFAELPIVLTAIGFHGLTA